MTPETFIPPSGSKLALGEACPASMVLPRTREEAGEAAEIGTGVHAFVEGVARVLRAGPDLDDARAVALGCIPLDAPWRARCESLDLERLELRADSLHEAGFSFDPIANVVRYHGTGHAHGTIPASPGWIVGVLDRVTDLPGLDRVEVDDWKTGFLPVEAKGNLQLLFGAVCAARHFGRQRARVSIVKLSEDGRARHDVVDLDAWDLDEAVIRLAALVDSGREQARRLGAHEPLAHVQGKACRYCPCFNACVPSMRAIVTMAREPLNVENEITDLILTGSDEDAAKAWLALERWDTVAKRLRIAIYNRARNAPIPFSDGTVYGEREVRRTSLDGEKVFAEIAAAHGADAAALTVAKKATKKGIRAAAKLVTGKRKAMGGKATIVATETELLDMLAAKGASTTSTKTKIDRHRPGESAGDEGEDE